MATAYSTVYNLALSKMREYSFLDMYDDDIYNSLSPFLQSAESDFSRICVEDLRSLTGERRDSCFRRCVLLVERLRCGRGQTA